MSTNSGPTTAPQAKVPQIVMDEMVYQKIMHWVNKSNYEVSGLGKVVVEESGNIRITDAILLPQKNTQTTTDIEAADFGKAAWLMKDIPGELQFWWHSHVNMGVFWSGTDMATIYALSQGGWFVNTVFNKKHQTKTCLAMNVRDPNLPMKQFPLIYDDLPLVIERAIPSDVLAGWDKEYEDKVTNMVPKFPASPGNHRFPRFPSQATQVFTAEERAALAELASQMTDEDDETTPLSAFGDLSEAGWQARSRTSELAKGETNVHTVLSRRDRLENSIAKMEDRVEELERAGARIPPKLAKALEKATEDLMDIDEELDQMEQAGIITPADRAMMTSHENYMIGD